MGWTLRQGPQTRSPFPAERDSLPQGRQNPGARAPASAWEAHGEGVRTLAWRQGLESKHTAAFACVVSVLCFYIYIYISLILLKKEKESF